jgi:hypothetical protein
MNERRAYVAGGHVYCREKRRDTDVIQCLNCPRLIEMNKGSSPPYIVCELSHHVGGIFSDDPGFREWWHAHHRRGG